MPAPDAATTPHHPLKLAALAVALVIGLPIVAAIILARLAMNRR